MEGRPLSPVHPARETVTKTLVVGLLSKIEQVGESDVGGLASICEAPENMLSRKCLVFVSRSDISPL